MGWALEMSLKGLWPLTEVLSYCFSVHDPAEINFLLRLYMHAGQRSR